MIQKIINLIELILLWFLNKDKVKKIEENNKVIKKQEEVNFRSDVETIARNVESPDEAIKAKAIEDIRKLIAE